MAMERRFGVQVGGLQFDLASFPDMPEEVRRYLDEMAGQMDEDRGEGNYKIPADNMLPAVNEWIRAKIADLQKRMKAGDLDAVKVENMDREWFAGHMDRRVSETLAQIDTATGGKYTPELVKTADLLCGSWRMLIKRDGDWRGLGSELAAKLFHGVVIAALLRTASMERAEEDGHEEA